MNAEPLRVLLVEDNPGDARLIREMLAEGRATAWPIEHVDRLAPGLDRLARPGIDLVLLDLSLPDSQGLDTFRRTHAQAPQVPIVLLSGMTDETLAVQAVQEGAQDYLLKGQIDGPFLVRAMRYAIERQRAEEERRQLLARERAARAEAEALAAERAAILGQVADGVVITDPAGQLSFLNAAARRMLGRAELGVPLDGFATTYGLQTGAGQPFPAGESPLERAALGGEPVLNAEWRIQRPDQSVIVAQGSATPVLAEDGERLGTVLTFHDVTAQRDLERQRNEFLANVSHDLRTPLAAIKASIGVVLASEPPGTPEPLHRLFVNIDLAAERLTRLVVDLLELTRLQAGRAQLRLDHSDLVALAQRAVRLVEAPAQARGQRVVVELPDAPVVAVVDAERLERALVNLLSNAYKYGRQPEGTIQLRLLPAEREVLVAVTDDGLGIPTEEQGRIFERFHRVESEATQHVPGIGLGLPIVRATVELHGGRVWVESAPGAGTTFWIALPLEPAPAGASASPPP